MTDHRLDASTRPQGIGNRLSLTWQLRQQNWPVLLGKLARSAANRWWHRRQIPLSGSGLVMVLAISGLVGCATTPTDPTLTPATILETSQTNPSINIRSVSEGLRLARLVKEPLASAYRAKAARLALNAGNLIEAEGILKRIAFDNLRDQGLVDFVIASADLALAQDKPAVALAHLNRPNFNQIQLSESDQIALGLAKARAYELTGRVLSAAQERVLVSPLLSPEGQTQNQELLFMSLMALPPKLLKNYAEQAVTNDLRGWLSLAAMTKQYQNRPSQQLRSLTNWKRLWVGHPAAKQLPQQLSFLDSVVAGQPKKIAILLPQTGPLASAGQAVLNGLLAAHFEQGRESDLLIYDSHQWSSATDLLDQAQTDGADFAVGPLDKGRVAELANARLPIPVLALNRLTGTTNKEPKNGNLFFFSLAPEDEARQLARHSETMGFKNILLIAPDSDWGDRTTNAFRASLKNRDDIEILEKRFTSDQPYAPFVRNILAVDESLARANELSSITGRKFEFTPRRRQDIDMIGLLTNAAEAKQINPALAFYYADDLPVYATSLVNEDDASKISNLDLNGIRFCDMPWKLSPESALFNSLNKLIPDANGSVGGLFALGLDAFNVIPRLRQLREMADLPFYGYTGRLSMEQQVVVRQLMWGTFDQGSVTALPTVVESI